MPVLVCVLSLIGCKRQHHPIASTTALPYPVCDGPAEPTQVLASGILRSGPADTRMAIVETFRLEKRGCLFATVTRQEWPMQIADVEALYDASWKPLRVWRRHTSPISRRPDGSPDLKLFELRTPEVVITHKAEDAKVDHEILRFGSKPEVLIGPGRGAMTAWLWQAKLSPGQKTHATTLDFRGVEKLERGALERRPDAFVENLGRVARIYTYFGQETIYADENDVVIGDLAGLVPDAIAKSRRIAPMPRFEPIDPRSL